MIIKNNDKVLNYVGKFETFMKENETVISSNTKGSYVEFKFTGKGFKYYAHTNAWRGISIISIDGIIYKEIDLYSQNEKNNVLVYEINNLEFKEHIVKIEVKGIKRTESKDTKVTFMYFDIDDVDENKDALETEVSTLNTTIENLNNIITEKSNKITELENRITELEAQVANRIDLIELKSIVAELKSIISE